MKFKKLIIYIIVGILLTVTVLLTSMEVIAFNMDNFRDSFEKNNISSVTGMDQKNLEYVIEDLLQYLKVEDKTLDTKAVINGEEIEVYGEREKLHMVDVKDLFIKGEKIRNISFYTLLLLTIALIIKDKLWKRNLSRALLYTGIVINLLLALLLILFYIDFNKYFTIFHLIFFNNDLWILDPNTDILIQLVPEKFFYDTVTKIIILFAGSSTVTGIIGYLTLKRQSISKVKNKKK